MTVYADTSFLVSLYFSDAHSAPAARALQSKPVIYLTPLIELELVNALELALFRQLVDASAVRASLAAIRQDIEGGVFSLQPLPATAFQLAASIARRRSARLGTRTLDILHVASALLLRADRFLTFDARQRRLARAEGLKLR